MFEQLLADHQGIVRGGLAPGVGDFMDDGADIAGIHLFQRQLPNVWGYLFVVDALGDVWVFQPSAYIVLVPIQKQLLDRLNRLLLLSFSLGCRIFAVFYFGIESRCFASGLRQRYMRI